MKRTSSRRQAASLLVASILVSGSWTPDVHSAPPSPSSSSSSSSPSSLGASETTWTPESIKNPGFLRHVMTLDPGSTIRLGDGEFAPIRLPPGIGLQGAGIGATVIVAQPDDYVAVSLQGAPAPSRLSDLSIRDADPAANADNPNRAALSIFSSSVIVENIAIGPFAGTGIRIGQGAFEVRDVALKDVDGPGLYLSYVLPETVVERVSVEGARRGFDLDIGEMTGGVFRDLKLTGDADGGIVVKGPDSAPRFENIDPDTLDDILYEWGAAYRPEVTEADEEALRGLIAEASQMDWRSVQYEFREEEVRPLRREMARKYLQDLAATGGDPAAELRALETYILGLVETAPDLSFDPWGHAVAEAELRWLRSRQGAPAIAGIFAKIQEIGYDIPYQYFEFFDEEARAEIEAAMDAARAGEAETLAADAFEAFRRALADAPSDRAALAAEFQEACRRYWSALPEETREADSAAPLAEAFALAADSGDVETIAALVAVLPVAGDSELPSRRLLLRELSPDIRRAVMPLLRER